MSAEIDRWCTQHRIDCVYFLADPLDPPTLRQAESSGYHLVDIRMALARDLGDWSPPPSARSTATVRPMESAALPDVKAIAARNHRHTRFYADPYFPQEKCDQLYATWIENSYHGFADVVLIALEEQVPVGYITCKIHPDQAGEIGLLGVAPQYRGRGIGQTLVTAGFEWFVRHHVRRVRVVTQGHNIPSQRLYQRCGFYTDSVHLWYHRWFRAPITSFSKR